MDLSKRIRWCLFISAAFLLSGCVETVGSLALSSAFGVAGNSGLNYYGSGTIERVVYIPMAEAVSKVDNAIAELEYSLESKFRYTDDSIRYKVKVSETSETDINIKLIPVTDQITEIRIDSRKYYLIPDKSACHMLMQEITSDKGNAEQEMGLYSQR